MSRCNWVQDTFKIFHTINESIIGHPTISFPAKSPFLHRNNVFMAFILRITGNYRKLIELQLPQYFRVIKNGPIICHPNLFHSPQNTNFLHNNNGLNIVIAVLISRIIYPGNLQYLSISESSKNSHQFHLSFTAN